MDAKRARDVARLEKEAGTNAQAVEVDAQASASERAGSLFSSQPKRSRKRNDPDNLPGTRSTRSNPSRGGRGGKGAKGGKGG